MHLSTRAPARSQAGFTLIEVLTASFILMVGILATLTVLTSANGSNATSQRNEVASREAEHQLEQMRGQCYGALSMTSTHPAPGTSAFDPLRRVSAGKYTVQTGLVEDVTTEHIDKVAGDNCTDANGDGKVDAAVDPVSSITIGSGSAALTGKVYRFVSWRDEECPIVNLTHLEGVIQDLKTLTTVLAGPTGTLTSLLGSTGSLTNLVSDTTGTVTVGNTASVLQKLLTPTIVTLTSSILSPLLSNTLNPLVTQLTPMLAPLQALLAPLSSLLDAITQRIDLCDLPKLLDLSSFETLDTALTTVTPVIGALAAPTANLSTAVHSLASLNLVSLLTASVTAVLTLPPLVSAITTAATNTTNILNSVKADAANGQTKIKTLAQDAKTAVDTLLNQPNTTHNTKRLTVALWLDTNSNAGVNKPVWASTVVSDPKDGLL
jgi:type II secretory pathway pseudopilin PulG